MGEEAGRRARLGVGWARPQDKTSPQHGVGTHQRAEHLISAGSVPLPWCCLATRWGCHSGHTKQHTLLSADGIHCAVFAGDEPRALQHNELKSLGSFFVLLFIDVKATPCPGRKTVPWIGQQSWDARGRGSWVGAYTLCCFNAVVSLSC